MHKERKDKHFLKKPIYEGGPKAMKAFIKENLKYPEKALKERIEGSVSLKFDINHKGKVTAAKVISSLGYGCDEEAQRIVKLLEFKIPKTRKLKVIYHKNITIHFRLPKQQPQPTKTNIQYNITLTKSKQPSVEKKESNKKQGGGYSYTITI